MNKINVLILILIVAAGVVFALSVKPALNSNSAGSYSLTSSCSQTADTAKCCRQDCQCKDYACGKECKCENGTCQAGKCTEGKCGKCENCCQKQKCGSGCKKAA